MGAAFRAAVCRCGLRRSRAPLRLRRGSSYGIQDDAWLESGPGDARPAAGDVQAARCAARPLHAPLERDRPAAAEESDLAARSRLRLASSGQGSARPSPPRSDARAHAGRDAGVGERGSLAGVRPAAAPRLPQLRERRRHALPVGSLLADLERAEQAPLAQTDEVDDLRPASAQSRVRGDPCRAAARSGRRRRDRASWRVGRRRTGRLDPRHGRAHAKLDAYAHHPYPSTPSETPSSGGCRTCPSITMATIRKLLVLVKRSFGPKPIWLTEYGYQSNPPDTFLGVPLKRQANMVSLAAMRAWRLPRVTMLIQYLYRDEIVLSRFQTGLVFANDRAEALAAGIQAAVRADGSDTGLERSSGVRSATDGPGGRRTGWRCSGRTCGRQSGPTG